MSRRLAASSQRGANPGGEEIATRLAPEEPEVNPSGGASKRNRKLPSRTVRVRSLRRQLDVVSAEDSLSWQATLGAGAERSTVAGAKGGLTARVAAELARPLRPGSRGEEIGSLDGLAALLASRRSHFCFDGAACGLEARVGPAVALALLDGLSHVRRTSGLPLVSICLPQILQPPITSCISLIVTPHNASGGPSERGIILPTCIFGKL